MSAIEIPPILNMPWDVLDDAEAQIRRILVNWQEFYAISHMQEPAVHSRGDQCSA